MSTPSTRRSTLQLTWPVGLVPLQALVLLVLIVAGAELLVRNETVQDALLPPLIEGDDQIAGKLLALDRQVARSGPPGCIILGSSMAWHGIDPAVVGQTFEDNFHQPFWCFNFSLRGMDGAAAGRLATILVREYHPHLLIYGTHFRDYRPFWNSLDIPWTNYYLGAPTLDGWLQAHLYVMRYALSYSYLIQYHQLPDPVLVSSTPDGFAPVARASHAVGQNGLNVSKDKYFKSYAAISRTYAMDPDTLAGLEQLTALKSTDLQVVVVEMPMPSGMVQALPRGDDTQRMFHDAVQARVDPHGVLFWQDTGGAQIPDDGWWNLFHLNTKGAGVFSHWLAGRLVDAVRAGTLSSPVR